MASQWKNPEGTKCDICNSPRKVPWRPILNMIMNFKVSWGCSFPPIRFFRKQLQLGILSHLEGTCNDFGFDSISRLFRHSGSYWHLNLHWNTVKNKICLFATESSPLTLGLKHAAESHFSPGQERHQAITLGSYSNASWGPLECGNHTAFWKHISRDKFTQIFMSFFKIFSLNFFNKLCAFVLCLWWQTLISV